MFGGDAGSIEHLGVVGVEAHSVGCSHDPPPLRYALESISRLHCSTNDHDGSSNGKTYTLPVRSASGISMSGGRRMAHQGDENRCIYAQVGRVGLEPTTGGL
jgi:hypothetical protein